MINKSCMAKEYKVPMSQVEFKHIMSQDCPQVPAFWDTFLWNQWVDTRSKDPNEFAKFMRKLSEWPHISGVLK